MAGKWISANAYAEAMGLSANAVREMCRNGKLVTQKVGSVWRVWYWEPQEAVEDRKNLG